MKLAPLLVRVDALAPVRQRDASLSFSPERSILKTYISKNEFTFSILFKAMWNMADGAKLVTLTAVGSNTPVKLMFVLTTASFVSVFLFDGDWTGASWETEFYSKTRSGAVYFPAVHSHVSHCVVQMF